MGGWGRKRKRKEVFDHRLSGGKLTVATALHKQSLSVNIPVATRELFSKARQNLNEWRKKRGQNGITGWTEYFNAVAVAFKESMTYYCKNGSASSEDPCEEFFPNVASVLGCDEDSSDLRKLELQLDETDIDNFVDWIRIEEPEPSSYRYPVKMRTLTKRFFMRNKIRDLWKGCKALSKRR